MHQYFFRFRSVDAILGIYAELEKQEVHFADPTTLNDAMEGYRLVWWKGEERLWWNLLRHYAMCLSTTSMTCLLLPDDDKWCEPPIPVRMIPSRLPTDLFRTLCAEVFDELRINANVVTAVKQASASVTGLNQEELLFYITLIHPYAIAAVAKALERQGLGKAMPAVPVTKEQEETTAAALAAWSKLDLASMNNDRAASFFASYAVRSEMNLIATYNARAQRQANKIGLILYRFPESYINACVSDLTHPPWSVACFSAVCDDASMWGLYGSEHRGVALKFIADVTDGRPSITLRGIVGTGQVKGQEPSRIDGDIKLAFEEVSYATKPPTMDFFSSLGRLSNKEASEIWYDGLDTNSTDIGGRRTGTPEWREAYWSEFQKSVTTKLIDWKREREFRLVLPDMLEMRGKSCNLVYDFSKLAGIVFGLRTSLADKLRIIDFVQRKCAAAGRTDFISSQMYYNAGLGKLEELEMSLVTWRAPPAV